MIPPTGTPPAFAILALTKPTYEMTKRGEALSLKGKDHSENTEEKGGSEPRRDDLLWKDLLSRFFVPMLHSLLPELARDIDNKRDVVFLDKELRRLARFTRRPEGGVPDEYRCKLCVPKFKLCANAFCYSDSSKPKPRGFAST